MIDHVSIGTHDLPRATQFYTACFEPLGYTLQHQDPDQVIYGADGAWNFCLYPASGDGVLAGHRSHIAVSAPSQQAVRAFFDRAASGGASTLREPGLRPDINERYYGAMISDPDGHTIEVVHWSAA